MLSSNLNLLAFPFKFSAHSDVQLQQNWKNLQLEASWCHHSYFRELWSYDLSNSWRQMMFHAQIWLEFSHGKTVVYSHILAQSLCCWINIWICPHLPAQKANWMMVKLFLMCYCLTPNKTKGIFTEPHIRQNIWRTGTGFPVSDLWTLKLKPKWSHMIQLLLIIITLILISCKIMPS